MLEELITVQASGRGSRGIGERMDWVLFV